MTMQTTFYEFVVFVRIPKGGPWEVKVDLTEEVHQIRREVEPDGFIHEVPKLKLQVELDVLEGTLKDADQPN